jgi:hypothetical protein
MSLILDRPTTGAASRSTAIGHRYVDGVAVVMPAYREEENLEATVEDFLTTLSAAGEEHCVVVVDDGSSDGTGELLDRLAERHPNRVVAVHHEVNRGYGAAVRTGIAAALEQTEMQRILLTDSDGQFHAEDLITFLRVQRRQRADAVIGHRKHRADPLRRKVNALMWTSVSRVLLRTGSRDIDCAYKLIDRRLLEDVTLTGEAAAISPELLAKIRGPRRLIVEHPVQHHPRLHGDQTGARLSVILRSLASLGRVYLDLVRERRRWARARRALHPIDRALAATTVGAAAVSIVAAVHYAGQGTSLAYPDAVSHVLIARRVLDSPTAGAAQLGGVWLPLPHLLSLPFIWSRSLYESGWAGTLISMAAFVATARYLYRLTTRLADSRYAGAVAALLFVANANTIYLQSTPMTETLLLACIAAAVYHLHEWCRSGDYGQLAAASVATLLATLTRYEGWVLAAAVAGVVAHTLRRRRQGYVRFEAHMIFFSMVAFSGIAGWVLWNAAIFKDPLNFQNGAYAKPSLWVSHGEPAIGDWGAALRTYLHAMTYDMGWVALVLGAAGLVLHLVRHRLRAGSLAPYALLVFLPFFVYALEAGQRPLHVPEVGGLPLYNVRFGLVMLLGTSVFSGYLIGRLLRGSLAVRGRYAPALALAVAAVVVVVASVAVPGSATEAEATAFRASSAERANATASRWLRRHYDGGPVLMESFGNESVTFGSRIPTERIVYEGSFRMWEPALEHPASHGIRWVYLRTTPGGEDDTARALAGTPQLENDYVLVYEDADRQIYRRDDHEDGAS